MKMHFLWIALAFQLVRTSTYPPGAGTVSGQILWASGAPAVGATVTLVIGPISAQRYVATFSGGKTITDSAGRYRFENVGNGNYYVVATVDKSDFPLFYPGETEIERADTVQIVGNAVTADFAFKSPTGVHIRGQVGTMPERAYAGAFRVGIVRTGTPNGVPWPSVEIDPNGNFDFANAPPGPYTLRVTPSSYCGSRTQLQVDRTDVDNLELKAPPFIVGRFVVEGGDPLPLPPDGTSVYANIGTIGDGEGCPQRNAYPHGVAGTSPDGFFYASIAAGEYLIRPMTIPLGYTVKSIRYRDQDLFIESLKIANGQPTSEIVVTLTKPSSGISINGRIVSPVEGQPPAKSVVIQRDNVGPQDVANAAYAEIQPDGTFTFEHVPPGSFRLQAWPVLGVPEGDATRSGVLRIKVENQDVAIDLPRSIFCKCNF